MRRILNSLLLTGLVFLPGTILAVTTQAKLVLSANTARAGETILAGVQLKMAPGWHTYWQNSGASGIPTTVKWDLPAGITAGEIQWPVPKKLPPDDLVTYAYEDEVVLIVPLRLAGDLKPGRLELKAAVSWLECKEQCVPGSEDVSAMLQTGNESKPSAEAGLIQAWQKKLPLQADGLHPRAWWEAPAQDDSRQLILEWDCQPTAQVDFYPQASDAFEVQSPVQSLQSESGKIRIRKPVKKYSGDWPQKVSGLLIQKNGEVVKSFNATFDISDASPPAAGGTLGKSAARAGPEDAAPTSVLKQPLWKMLLYAFIGGLILNVMPCVLPVIALKILGFVGESRNDPRRVRALGLFYGLGVEVSFVALAALVLGVKAAGHKAGWGMQFGSPEFMVVLITLVTLVALNLFGVFEVTLSGRVMGAAGNLAAQPGFAGAFFNGVLATILATPCTAPFLGVSLGFAFAQTAPITVLMFLIVGAGLALPYVLLAWEPAWLKFLPKPGAWMEKFKILMGFPMLATAVWLFSIVADYYGDRSWWLGIFLIVVALAAWVFGQFFQRGGKRRGLAAAATIVLLLLGYVGIAEDRLNWRQPDQEQPTAASRAQKSGGVDWQPWSHEAIEKARAEGRPVLVDFTAKWCLTCNTIVKPALESESVRAKLKEFKARALLADYTRYPPEITEELSKFGRAGVPMVLVYPANPAEPPAVLPEVLTPGIVVEALEKAAH